MKFFRKQRAAEPTITRTEALLCRPLHSPEIHWQQAENGDILIEYNINLKPFFIEIARKFSKQAESKITKKLQLDAIGSRVWQMIDGQNDVKSIIRATSEHSGLSLQEAETSVTTFLRQLGRRGLIQMK